MGIERGNVHLIPSTNYTLADRQRHGYQLNLVERPKRYELVTTSFSRALPFAPCLQGRVFIKPSLPERK